MTAYQHLSHGFDPVFDERSRILILGSFPSVLSRRNDFYYGNPHNRFWRVIASCAGVDAPGTIPEKKALLLSRGIALWDVIESCDIKGSSDASIKNVVPAHVERILSEADIASVICNGGTAGRLYHRYLEWKTKIEAATLPSTSPANASWSLDRLVKRWSDALGGLPEIAPAAVAKRAGENPPAERSGAALANAASRAALAPAPPEAGEPGGTLSGTPAPQETRPSRTYAVVKIPAPEASNYAVHRSMQGNKRKDTKPELLVRARLRAAGLTGYRLQWHVAGRPDIAWPGKRVALFINGCFWHRCPRCHPSMPSRNVDYWEAKFRRNVERDKRNLRELREAGWTVHVIWECQLKKKTIDATFEELLPQLSSELGKQLR